MTRSGRVFAPEHLRKETNGVVETPKVKEAPSQDQGQGSGDKSVSKENDEFLKIIKNNGYKVVDQLNQTPSKISILSLLLNSEAHRVALLNILNQAHVTQDVTVDSFEGIVANITADSCLGFSNKDLPPDGKYHNKALHITMAYYDTVLARVLVYTGSSLNVLPKSTLNKLAIDGVCLKPSSLIVKAFDGSRRSVIGEVCLPIQIGPCIFDINFQVMDINPAYSCLLGRSWIHAAGAVTSTLHQKLRFAVDDKLVTIVGEEDIFVSHLSSFRYVKSSEGALEVAFQALEVANVVATFERAEEHKNSVTLWKNGTPLPKGLSFSGCGKLWGLAVKKDKHGVGYKKTGSKIDVAKAPFVDIKESFRSAGFADQDHVAAIGDAPEGEEMPCLVYRRSSSASLDNWTAVEIPKIISISK